MYVGNKLKSTTRAGSLSSVFESCKNAVVRKFDLSWVRSPISFGLNAERSCPDVAGVEASECTLMASSTSTSTSTPTSASSTSTSTSTPTSASSSTSTPTPISATTTTASAAAN